MIARPSASDPTHAEKDPVCGMTVDRASAKAKREHEGRTYYFCNPRCAEKFDADPAKYTGPSSTANSRKSEAAGRTNAALFTCPMHPEIREHGPGSCPKCGMALESIDPAPALNTEYVCPMHPEIVRKERGSCPICGMALEPRVASAVEEENPELAEMSRRFWISLPLATVLFVVAMSEMIPGRPIHAAVGEGRMPWLQMALATPVVFWGGWPFFVRGWMSVARRNLNMFTLIALGTGVAYGYSVFSVLLPDRLPHGFRGHGRVDVYFEAAAVITVLVLLGQVLGLFFAAAATSGSA